MFRAILEAAGLIRSTAANGRPFGRTGRRARWRGSDGQWHWAAV
jgi:hypothetical protein